MHEVIRKLSDRDIHEAEELLLEALIFAPKEHDEVVLLWGDAVISETKEAWEALSQVVRLTKVLNRLQEIYGPRFKLAE